MDTRPGWQECDNAQAVTWLRGASESNSAHLAPRSLQLLLTTTSHCSPPPERPSRVFSMEHNATPPYQHPAMADRLWLGVEFTHTTQSGEVNAVGSGVAGPSTSHGTKRPASASPEPERPTKRLGISDEIFNINQSRETATIHERRATELSNSFEDELRCVEFHICCSAFILG